MEKVRVTSQNVGERNFHVFYQLLGAPEVARKRCVHLQLVPLALRVYFALQVADSMLLPMVSRLRLDLRESYAYLSQALSRKGAVDGEDFAATEAAMLTVGFSEEAIHAVYCVLASILHLGNVKVFKVPSYFLRRCPFAH